MSSISRRKFVKDTATYSLITCFLASGGAVADWPTKAFSDKSQDKVIKALFGNTNTEISSLITVVGPDLAENGAVVPIKVNTQLSGVESVAILVDNNPNPLAAHFLIQPGNSANIGTRIKLAKPSVVTAVVKANGKLYTSSKKIKITRGGC